MKIGHFVAKFYTSSSFSVSSAPKTKRHRPKSDVEVSDFSQNADFLKENFAHPIWPPSILTNFHKAIIIISWAGNFKQTYSNLL